MDEQQLVILQRVADGEQLEYKQVWTHVWKKHKNGWSEPISSYKVRALIRSGLLDKNGKITALGLEKLRE